MSSEPKKYVQEIIEKHKDDDSFLDALYQYADSPTSVSALKKYYGNENFDADILFKYIPKNLDLRYPDVSGEKVVEEVKNEVRRFSNDFRIHSSSDKDLRNIRRKIKEEINTIFESKTNLKDLEKKDSIYVLAKFIKENNEKEFKYSRNLRKNKRKEFCAFHQATLDYEISIDYLTKIGLVNKLKYVSTSKNFGDRYKVPEYWEETFKSIENRLESPEKPDDNRVDNYLNSLFQENRIRELKDVYLVLREGGFTTWEEEQNYYEPRIIWSGSEGTAVSLFLKSKLKNSLKEFIEREQEGFVSQIKEVLSEIEEDIEPAGSTKWFSREDYYLGELTTKRDGKEFAKLDILVWSWISQGIKEHVLKNAEKGTNFLIFALDQDLYSATEDMLGFPPVKIGKKEWKMELENRFKTRPKLGISAVGEEKLETFFTEPNEEMNLVLDKLGESLLPSRKDKEKKKEDGDKFFCDGGEDGEGHIAHGTPAMKVIGKDKTTYTCKEHIRK